MQTKKRRNRCRGAGLSAVAVLLAVSCPASAVTVEPGGSIQVPPDPSDHGVLTQTLFVAGSALKPCDLLCAVAASPARIQLFAAQDNAGFREVRGFMARSFTVSPALADNDVDAVIRLSLRLNGRLSATGQSANSEVRIIASVQDVTGGSRELLARGQVASLATSGGAFNVSLRRPGGGSITVPLPVPKLDRVANEGLRHFVQVRLKRGHTYRLAVVLEGVAQQAFDPATGVLQRAEVNFSGSNPVPFAAPGIPGGLHWDQATVGVGDDLVEILRGLENSLGEHDQRLEDHDARVLGNQTVLLQNQARILDELAVLHADLDSLQARTLRLAIEENLGASPHGPVALFQRPQSAGGHLELVRALVELTIVETALGGESVHQAQRFLARGDASFDRGRFKEAYESYRKAYSQAATRRGDDDSDSNQRGPARGAPRPRAEAQR